MIKFKSISWKNFCSYSNEETIFDFDQSDLVLITGKNGSGKSVLIDAIHYVLFGKPYRKIKIGDLINRRNKKNTLVTLAFSRGKDEYIVSRGLKPNIFQIEKNNEKLPPYNTLTQQEEFENNVLGFDEKTFNQIVVMGSSYHIPFLRLNTSQRRIFIEQLFDLNIFSRMKDILKLKNDEQLVKKNDLTLKLSSLNSALLQFESELARINSHNENQKKLLSEEKLKIENEIEKMKIELSEILEELKQIKSVDIEEIENKIVKSEQIIAKIQTDKQEFIRISTEEKNKTDKEYTKYISDKEIILNSLTENFKFKLSELESKQKLLKAQKEKEIYSEKEIELEKQNTSLNEINNNGKNLELEIAKINQSIALLKSNLTSEFNTEFEQSKNEKVKILVEIQNNKKQLDFYSQNKICYTCKTVLEGGHVEKLKAEIQQEINISIDKIAIIDNEESELKKKYEELFISQKNEMNSKLTDIEKTKSNLISEKFDVETKINNIKEKFMKKLLNIDVGNFNDGEKIEAEFKKEKEKISVEIENLKNQKNDSILKIQTDFENKIKELNNQIDEAKNESEKLKTSLNEARSEKQKEQLLVNKRTLIESGISEKKSSINNLDKVFVLISIKEVTEKKDLVESDIKNIESELNKIHTILSYFSVCKDLLSDSGIKGFIIEKYLFSLNSKLKEFLSFFETQFVVEFDKELDAKVLERNSEVDYEAFSGGERQRIDLSILFSFMSFCKTRAKTSTNLLIFDEILDSSLDEEGIDILVGLLEKMSQSLNYSIYVISHRSTNLNRFKNTFVISKDIFSKVEKR